MIMNKRRPLKIATAAALLVLGSCGTQEKEGGVCTISLKKEASSETQSEMRKVVFRGDFSTECQEVYNTQSGRASIKINVTSPKSPGAYLSALAAGDRSFAFGSGYSLTEGSLETKFSSDTLKTWTLPWPDKPGTTSLTILVPLISDEKLWPTSATLELKAGD